MDETEENPAVCDCMLVQFLGSPQPSRNSNF